MKYIVAKTIHSSIMPNIREIFLEHQSRLLTDRAAHAAKSQQIRKRWKIATVHSLRVAFYRTKIPKAMCFHVAQYLRVGFPESQDMRKRRKIAMIHSLCVAFYRKKIPKDVCIHVAQYLCEDFPKIPTCKNAFKVITSYSKPPSANLNLPGACLWNIFDQYTHVEPVHTWWNEARETFLDIVYPTIPERVELTYVPGMRSYFERMSLKELKRTCREKHVKSSGTKAKLVENLLYQSLWANSEIVLY